MNMNKSTHGHKASTHSTRSLKLKQLRETQLSFIFLITALLFLLHAKISCMHKICNFSAYLKSKAGPVSPEVHR